MSRAIVSADLTMRAERTLRLIREDIAQDVRAMEGAPFDGRTVSVAIGNLAAQVDALAGILLAILAEAGDRP